MARSDVEYSQGAVPAGAEYDFWADERGLELADQLFVGNHLFVDHVFNELNQSMLTPFLRMMDHTETVLSSPEATSRDLSEFMTKPVTEVRLLRLSILWLRVIEKMLIFLS